MSDELATSICQLRVVFQLAEGLCSYVLNYVASAPGNSPEK